MACPDISSHAISIRFTTSGTVEDFTTPVRALIVDVLAIAAGIEIPNGISLITTPGSVNVEATIPFESEAAMQAGIARFRASAGSAEQLNALFAAAGLQVVASDLQVVASNPSLEQSTALPLGGTAAGLSGGGGGSTGRSAVLLIVLVVLAILAFACLLCCQIRRHTKQRKLEQLIEWTASERSPEGGYVGQDGSNWLQLVDQSKGAAHGPRGGDEGARHEQDKTNAPVRIERVGSPHPPTGIGVQIPKSGSVKPEPAQNKIAPSINAHASARAPAKASVDRNSATEQHFISTSI